MKILINTFGTRGDIQPFIALAQGLQKVGHSPVICTAEGFRPFIEAHGVAYAHLDNSLYELINAQAGKEILEGKGNAFALYKQVGPMMQRMMEDEWQAAQTIQPDFILYHPKSLGSYHIAEKLNLPLALALPLPSTHRPAPIPHRCLSTICDWAAGSTASPITLGVWRMSCMVARSTTFASIS